MVRTMNKKKSTDKNQETVHYVIARGNMDNASDARKINDLNVIVRFVQSKIGGTVHRGKHALYMEFPPVEGDTRWTEVNVVRFVDIQKAYDDEGAVKISKSLIARLDTFGDVGVDKVGIGLIDYYLEKMYMRFDRWSDKNGEEEQ